MKVVKLSHPNYEYDVHSLVKAFYAEEQVTVITPETKPEKLAELEPQVSLEIELEDTVGDLRGTDAGKVSPWEFLPGHLA